MDGADAVCGAAGGVRDGEGVSGGAAADDAAESTAPDVAAAPSAVLDRETAGEALGREEAAPGGDVSLREAAGGAAAGPEGVDRLSGGERPGALSAAHLATRDVGESGGEGGGGLRDHRGREESLRRRRR